MDTPDENRGPQPPPDQQRLKIEIDGKTMWQFVGVVLATLALLWMLGQARHLLGLVVISFFFSLALQPLVMRLVARWGWRRGSAVGVIYLAGFIAMILVFLVLIPAIVTLAQTIGDNAAAWVQDGITWVDDTFGVSLSDGGFDQDNATSVEDELTAWAKGAIGNIFGIATSGLGLLFDLATMGMFIFYFTADAPRLQRSILGLLSPDQQHRIGWTWDQAIIQTGGYFYSRIILWMINGTGFFFTMVLVGMPVGVSLVLAVIGAFIAEFIPAIGTYIGSAIPIAITLAMQGWVAALVILGYALVYQQVENYWLSPKISSNTMALNGAVAFGGALAGGAIFGPMGAFMALPIAALITAFVSNFARHNEVVYQFEYDAHLTAAKQAAAEAREVAERMD